MVRKKLCGLGTILLLALAYALDTEGLFPYFAAAALWHELGHVAAVYVCGSRIRAFTFAPFGFCLHFDAMLSYPCDAAIAAGGAGANLLAAFLLSVAAKYLPQLHNLTLASGVNLLIGLFHLLPALPLDGGRTLYAILAQITDEHRAFAVTRALSLLTGTAITALGVYILLKTRYNISILAVGSLILGGTYAQRAGKDFAARAKTRAVCGRRIRAGNQGQSIG